MATEVLAIPEEIVAETIRVIRTGLVTAPNISDDTRAALTSWCDDMEDPPDSDDAPDSDAPDSGMPGA